MTGSKRILKTVPLAALIAAAWPAQATNGMNMEGYGSISTALGGASQAIDHGSAAMAQNPATLALMALMAPGSRLDVAVGRLGPKVTSTMPGFGSAESGGTSYLMPAFGYVRRLGGLTYGVGVFAQGGMGTEYAANTFMAGGSGQPVRSELGVGRVLLPLAYQVTPELALGATLDFMWAGLDMRMAASGAQLGAMVTSASGNLGGALPALGGAPWARIDFSNSSDFSGAASSTGWAGKFGAVFKASPALTLGASYQLKSALKDMKTGNSGASLSATGGFADTGRITVVDFQWPSMAAVGLGWQATPALLVAADVKRIGWASVMKDFKLRYDSAGMGGSVSFAMAQNWKDQTVTNLGLAYAVNSQLTLRGGVNLADNPIPAAFVNPLFPATVERHYTAGLGYKTSATSEFNGALTVAPSSQVTNGMGVVVSHRQTNLQLMYSHRF
ncbi:MAG: outer membrane protein transport protein [Rubrivivax sp.]|nr:outer membrane protein transport protein [Rubrivivax sp.]